MTIHQTSLRKGSETEKGERACDEWRHQLPEIRLGHWRDMGAGPRATVLPLPVLARACHVHGARRGHFRRGCSPSLWMQ